MPFSQALYYDAFILLAASGITWFSMPSLIVLAKKRKLFEEPRDAGKLNPAKIPRLGGCAIFFACALVNFLADPGPAASSWNLVFAALLILFVTGLKDDLAGQRSAGRWMALLLAAGLVVYGGGIRIAGLHGLFGIHRLSYGVSAALTLLVFLCVTRVFIRLDRIGGLAGSAGLLVFALYGGYFTAMGRLFPACLAFSFCGSMIAFLRFNRSSSRIFMGRSGSLLLGFTAAILSIEFLQPGGRNLPGEASGVPHAVAGFAFLIGKAADAFHLFFTICRLNL